MKKGNINEELHSAVRTGNYQLVVRLINEGADVNYKDDFKNDALYYAIAHCQKTIVNYLLEKAASLKSRYKDDKNILHIAIETECEYKGVFEIVDSLVKNGADINAQDKYGNTALWYATTYYVVNEKTINYLLQNGADMYITNKYGSNTYSSAKENNLIPLIEILDKYRDVKK